MLKALKPLFDSQVPPADASFHADEREALRDSPHAKFGLADNESQRLAQLAETSARQATDFFTFTARINERFDMPQQAAGPV